MEEESTMWNVFRKDFDDLNILKTGLGVFALFVIFISPVQGGEVFSLKLDSRPFSADLCKKQQKGTNIRIKAAQHRDLVIHRIPGQYIPEDPGKARRKDYTHFITLEDLSNGAIVNGAIAFRTNQAIIFTNSKPQGISRQAFLETLPKTKQLLANQSLNTFLRLQPIINAAIDTCRPYPPTVTYGTDDEIDQIETGRLTYRTMIEEYNENPTPQRPLFFHETGMSGGFFDPEAERQARVSYQALNPLEFYVPRKQTIALTK